MGMSRRLQITLSFFFSHSDAPLTQSASHISTWTFNNKKNLSQWVIVCFFEYYINILFERVQLLRIKLTKSWPEYDKLSIYRAIYFDYLHFFFLTCLFQIMTKTYPRSRLLWEVIYTFIYCIYIYRFIYILISYLIISWRLLNNNVTFIKYDYRTENINIPNEHQVHNFFFQCW